MEKVSYLIVGQGIAGSLLAYELCKAGYSVRIWNHETENTSSNKAAGIYNPITGRKMVKTWLADELFPPLEAYYFQLEKELLESFIHPKPIYRPFFSHEEQNDWEGRASDQEFVPFIRQLHAKTRHIPGVIDPYGGLELNYSGYVDMPKMLLRLRKFFHDKGIYHSGVFEYSELTINEELVSYKDMKAERIIFCEGPSVSQNPYWNHLPFKHVKGEILEIDANLPKDLILNRSVFVLPKNGHYSVGSTYDHEHLNHIPSAAGIQNIKNRLSKIFDGEYREVSQSAGIRPATFDRRPFIGFHSKYPLIGIFNGFGTKGVSLVPYFASQLVNYFLGTGEVSPEADIRRLIK